MLKNYIVRLSQEERQTLQDLVSTSIAAAYKIKHANILLNVVYMQSLYPEAEIIRDVGSN